MPTTPIHALPYPAPGDSPDVPYRLQLLAERIEATVGSDTGSLTPTAAGFTAATGFTSLTGSVRRRGLVVAVDLIFTTTNALGAGDITNVTCVNIPAGYQTAIRANLVAAANGAGLFAVASGGTVTIGATNAGYAAGATVSMSGLWMV